MWNYIQKFFTKFSEDETTTLAASLAYYTALSLAPLLILFITVAAQFSPELQSSFLIQARSLVGNEAAQVIEAVIAGAKQRPDLTSIAGTFGILTLLLSASMIFGQLRAALNRIFHVQIEDSRKTGFVYIILNVVRERLVHVGFALAFIFTLIASLMVSSFLSAAVEMQARGIAFILNIAISLIFYILFFTLIFRFIPDRRQPWRCAAEGGILTAIFFVIGKELLATYLGRSAVGSAYGAAGSIIVLLVWVYYSTLITFVGAQVSSLLTGLASTEAKTT